MVTNIEVSSGEEILKVQTYLFYLEHWERHQETSGRIRLDGDMSFLPASVVCWQLKSGQSLP